VSVIDYTWEYRTATVEDIETCWYDVNQKKTVAGNKLSHLLTEWGNDGWEVITCAVPDPRNYSTYKVIAKRKTGSKYLEKTT
jgi:hypothetical protein